MLRRCHKECASENTDFKLDFYDRYAMQLYSDLYETNQ